MRIARARCRIGFCRPDIETAIHQCGIDTDQLQPKPVGERASKRSLARCGRTHQEDRNRTLVDRSHHAGRLRMRILDARREAGVYGCVDAAVATALADAAART